MNVLFFTYDFPFPTNSGGKNRVYNLLKKRDKNIQFILFSFYRNKVTNEQLREIKKIGIDKNNIYLFQRELQNVSSIVSSPTNILRNFPTSLRLANPFTAITYKLYYNDAIFTKLLEVIKDKKIDIIVYESFYTSYYIHNTIRALGVKQIFGTENIEHLLYLEYIKNNVPFAAKPFYIFEMDKIKKDEIDAIEKSDLCLAVTRDEAEYIQNTTGKRSEVIENGIDLNFFTFRMRDRKKNKNILFVGNFNYFANLDAIEQFYNNVFKNITMSNIQLTVIGKNAHTLKYIQDNRVVKIDYVDDIRDEYKKADILISPIRIGGGTNFKVLEAMATGLPVLALSDKVKSLEVEDGIHLLTADNIIEFGNKLKYLLEDDTLRRRLAKNARKFVEKRYDWEIIGAKFNSILKDIYESN